MAFLHNENQDLMADDSLCQSVGHGQPLLGNCIKFRPLSWYHMELHMCISVKCPRKEWVWFWEQIMFCRHANCKAQSFLGPKSKFSVNSTLCSCVIFFSSFIPPFLSLPASHWEVKVINILIFDRMDWFILALKETDCGPSSFQYLQQLQQRLTVSCISFSCGCSI